ncbi:MAG TPA: AAA family ATPase [Kineosporiaceae bacterium]|nr:AAA family ATPase [Kineosporiaceae bacterium]
MSPGPSAAPASSLDTAGANPTSAEPTGHRPTPAWKRRGTRRPLPWWDRTKFLVLIAALFSLLVWNEYLRIEPLGSWDDAATEIVTVQRWLVVLAGLELLRQLHFVISEHSAWYNRFWTEKVFGRFNRFTERRFSAWTRFRLRRVILIVFWIAVIAIVLGKVVDASPVVALFQAPALLIKALPMIAQITLLLLITIGQFAALFWFMSRGGVETYYPDDIETRFSDVWGQDHVVTRVQENMMLLDRPEAIEERGGHVPSGILLWGPPGTGKTLMAEAVAGETGKPYVFVDPGAFTNMFMGVGILKVKGLFRKLRKLALRYGGVIVFFDEADSLGSRGGAVAGATEVTSNRAGRSPAWDTAGCHGFSHLSEASRELLARASLPGANNGFVMPGNMNGGGNGGGMGTLQALLTELSGLKKPRGFINRVVRRALGMRPKPPPKYRILVMMATNQPDSLDPALLRPGRIDRIYRVGYPSKAGRVRTYQGYLDKTQHELTDEQVDKLATITPYATGATIKDLVNEALINAIREDRDTISWKDVIRAKHLKDLGPGEDVEYIERERHAVAVHEACHAVLAWATRRHLDIDIATIEKGSGYLGMVASIPPEEQFTRWRSEYESDILVSLASLAGERMFYDGDNSSGVSGDLSSATMLTALMESHWGMGQGITSLPALQQLGIGSGGPPPPGQQRNDDAAGPLPEQRDDGTGLGLGARVEQNLIELLAKSEASLTEHRSKVLALAHALEQHKTLTGEDVIAVLEGRPGPLVDGTPYTEPELLAELETYHEAAVEAHRRHAAIRTPLPVPRLVPTGSGEAIGESDAAWKEPNALT